MFYLLDSMNYKRIADDIDEFTINQQNIIKFIKNFDQEMEIKK